MKQDAYANVEQIRRLITHHKTTPACAVVYVASDPNRLHLADRTRGLGLSVFTLCLRRWSRRAKTHFDAKGDCQECRERQEQLGELPAADDPDICGYESPESRTGACDGGEPCTRPAIVFDLINEQPRCGRHFEVQVIDVNVRKPCGGVR